VELYRSQWAPQGTQGVAAETPTEGGEVHYDVNELELYKNQLAFCEKMVACNLMDFDE